jgi:hypothetical protein
MYSFSTKIKNRIICYLVKHTHLFTDTIYTVLAQVNDIQELKTYTREVIRHKEENKND